jgi:hypothetical protein
VRKFPYFIEPKSSLQRSEEHSSGLCPVPGESGHISNPVSLKAILILSSNQYEP